MIILILVDQMPCLGSNAMSWVLAEVFRSINHIPFAAEIINSVGNAFGVYRFLRAFAEFFFLFKANTIFDTVLEHSS